MAWHGGWVYSNYVMKGCSDISLQYGFVVWWFFHCLNFIINIIRNKNLKKNVHNKRKSIRLSDDRVGSKGYIQSESKRRKEKMRFELLNNK